MRCKDLIGPRAKHLGILTERTVSREALDMGLTPGTVVKVTKVAPLGDPMELNVRGYELSVRKADAEMIEVL